MQAYLAIVFGATFIALGLEFFYIPYHFIDGGMTGLAVVIGRSTGYAPANVLFLLNGACLWAGWRTLGRRFIYRAGVGLVTLWVLLDKVGLMRPVLQPVLAALAGGAIVGLGVGLIVRAGGGLDGCEILGQVCEAKFGVPVFWFQLVVNALVMSLVAIRYGVSTAFLSILAQVAGQVVLLGLLPTRSRGMRQR